MIHSEAEMRVVLLPIGRDDLPEKVIECILMIQNGEREKFRMKLAHHQKKIFSGDGHGTNRSGI